MKTMTATEASRAFAALLDQVERGEVIAVTRGGRRVAIIEPASAGNGAEILDLLRESRPDRDFAADVAAAREAVTLDGPAWPGA